METEIHRIPTVGAVEGHEDDEQVSESEMMAARAFKRQPLSTTSADNENMVRRVIDDSDQEESRNERGESVMIGKGSGIANRANRELSIRKGSNTPNHDSSKMKRQNRRDTVDNKSDHLSVYRYDGPEAHDNDVESLDGGNDFQRNRQVSYYVNKDAMREMENDGDDDDYGVEAKRRGPSSNIANQKYGSDDDY